MTMNTRVGAEPPSIWEMSVYDQVEEDEIGYARRLVEDHYPVGAASWSRPGGGVSMTGLKTINLRFRERSRA